MRKKRKGGEGVSLSDASGWLKGFRRSVIHKNGKEGGGNKSLDLVDPLIVEGKHS